MCGCGTWGHGLVAMVGVGCWLAWVISEGFANPNSSLWCSSDRRGRIQPCSCPIPIPQTSQGRWALSSPLGAEARWRRR